MTTAPATPIAPAVSIPTPVPVEIIDQLARIARHQGVTKAELVRELILAGLESQRG